MAYAIVMKLLYNLEKNEHCVVMDDCFCSMPLFMDLASNGILAIGTI